MAAGGTEGDITVRELCARGTRSLDPRAQLLAVTLLNLEVALGPDPWHQASAMALAVAATLFAGRGRAAITWVLLYLGFYLAVRAIARLDLLMMAGPASMLVMFLRVMPVFVLASNLIATTRTGELAQVLQSLGAPPRLIVALCVALRFPPTLAHESRSIAEAMRIRGILGTPASVLGHPVRSVERFMVPLIGRVGTIADELGNAVVARGGETSERRSSLFLLQWRGADALLCVALLLLVAHSVLAQGSMS